MGCQGSKLVGGPKVDSYKIVEALVSSGVTVFDSDDFEVGKYIAEGGGSKVYVGVNKITKKSYALKCFGYSRHKTTSVTTVEREIELTRKLQGVHGVVRFIGVLMDTEEGLLPNRVAERPSPVIIMELLEGGELYEHIAHIDSFSEQDIAKIFAGVVSTIHDMHQLNFLHRE